MFDYHMHTRFCRHAAGSMEDYARSAREKGIGEICFTPHIPLPGFRPGFWNDRLRMHESDFPRYLAELEKTRRLFPDLTILSGIEADYIPSMEGYLERFLSSHSFDFVLLSVHFVSAWSEDEWVFEYNGSRTLPSVYRDYFQEVRRGAGTGLFDCAAHLDLIKQPGKPVMETNRDDVEATLDALARSGMSVEINTSGSRKGIEELFPSDDIIHLMIQRGMPLVTGSDAHDPSHVGQQFAELGARWGTGLDAALVQYRARRMLRPGHRALAWT